MLNCAKMGVYYMSEDKLYQKAVTLIKSRNYEGAKAILEELDSLEAKRLLNRVNSALSKQKQEALGQRVTPPETPLSPDDNEVQRSYKPKSKNAPKVAEKNGTFALGCLALVVICGVCWISILPYMPNQPNDSAIEVCEWIDGISQVNTCSPERLMRDYRPQMDACYAVWNAANIYNIGDWAACLENKSVDLTD
jgi:hypothetical protein